MPSFLRAPARAAQFLVLAISSFMATCVQAAPGDFYVPARLLSPVSGTTNLAGENHSNLVVAFTLTFDRVVARTAAGTGYLTRDGLRAPVDFNGGTSLAGKYIQYDFGAPQAAMEGLMLWNNTGVTWTDGSLSAARMTLYDGPDGTGAVLLEQELTFTNGTQTSVTALVGDPHNGVNIRKFPTPVVGIRSVRFSNLVASGAGTGTVVEIAYGEFGLLPVTVETAVPPAPRHRYSFSETTGTQITDSLGGAHGTLRGTGSTRVPGALQLAGGPSATAAYIDLPNGMISSHADATIEGWVSLDAPSTWARVFDIGSGSAGELPGPGGTATASNYLCYAVVRSGIVGNEAVIRRVDAPGVIRDAIEPSGLPTVFGQRYHFAVVYDSDGNAASSASQPVLISLFRDGTLIGTKSSSLRLSSIPDVNCWLGRSNTTADANLSGTFDEFRVYDHALTTAQLQTSRTAGPEASPWDVSPAGLYQNWATAAGLTGVQAPPSAAPHLDGVPNLLKYAFNLNAGIADIRTITPGGTAGLPNSTLTGPTTAPVLRFEFLRRKGSGLIYTPQKNTGLSGTWLPLADTPTVTNLDATWERVVYEEPVTGGRWFARVEVALP
jgi:Concanavalin A-like lectin/glucanases superfamily